DDQPAQDQEDHRRVGHLVAEALDAVEHLLHRPALRRRHRTGLGHQSSSETGGTKPSASSASNRAPNPEQPAVCQVVSTSLWATPAMSRWAHGVPATNSSRNRAALI